MSCMVFGMSMTVSQLYYTYAMHAVTGDVSMYRYSIHTFSLISSVQFSIYLSIQSLDPTQFNAFLIQISHIGSARYDTTFYSS